MDACLQGEQRPLTQGNGRLATPPGVILDKNQGPGFTPGSVFLSSLKDLSQDDRLHCPMLALFWYLTRTKEIRGSEKFLFISSKEPHNRAAQSSKGGWVWEAINAAYRDLSAEEHKELGVRTHDTGGVAASWVLLARVPIQEIMVLRLGRP